MINYHVKKRKRTRYTLRLVGFVTVLVCMSQIIAFLMGYGRGYKIGTFIAGILCLYGFYLFFNSFRSAAYDIDYEFRKDDFVIHTRYGDKHHTYDEIGDLNQIIPENDMFYSIIQITIGKKQYLLPFSYKKEVADKLYAFLNERVVTKTLELDVKKPEENDSDGNDSESTTEPKE
ncbi:MAG: hypothetical protein J5517_04410 [Eubacterium sp.]|nr:hypothetical protein [Eubacterium sp.]